MSIELTGMHDYFGFGVAGNFAGHLEQAGEAADFAGVGEPAAGAPKGIFPFYVPGLDSFLGAYPLSTDRIVLPASDDHIDVQIEPEVGVACDIEYLADGKVAALHPFGLGAFNDCSMRMPDAKKISEKKNWGADSKGIARELLEVTDLEPSGPTKSLRLACFLSRRGETHAYGIDCPVIEYSYYGNQLLDWMVDCLNNQRGADDTPLEPIGDYLHAAGDPKKVLIGIGATRYTALGATTFLSNGDESIVVVYDGSAFGESAVADAIAEHRDADISGASVLRQRVEAG